MKTAFLPSFDICNIHGRELTVDLLLVESRNGNRETIFYLPGTTEHADEISTQIDEFDFHEAEMDAWWENAAPHFQEAPCPCESCTTDPSGNCVNCGCPAGSRNQMDNLLDLVVNLIRADEDREDTSYAATAIRNFFVDVLGRPDPLDSERLPDRDDVLDLGECIGEWPCGEDNEGHEAEYVYEGRHYILGHDERRTWYHLKDDEDESPNSGDDQG